MSKNFKLLNLLHLKRFNNFENTVVNEKLTNKSLKTHSHECVKKDIDELFPNNIMLICRYTTLNPYNTEFIPIMHNLKLNETYCTEFEIIKEYTDPIDGTMVSEIITQNELSVFIDASGSGVAQNIPTYDSEEFNETTVNIYCKRRQLDNLKHVIFGRSVSTTTRNTTLTKVDYLNLIPTRLDNSFRYCTKLNYVDLSNIITTELSSLRQTFYYCTTITTIIADNFNTSNITDMYATFRACQELITLNVSNWDTSNVTTIGYMFYNVLKLAEIDVSNWNTSKMNTIYYAFSGCRAVKVLDVSNWDTSNVNNMSNVFANCYELLSLNLANWDTSNVTHFAGTFQNCYKVSLSGLSDWNVDNLTSLYCTFKGCKLITSLDLSNWNISNVTTFYGAFYNCPALTNLNISNWNITGTPNVSDMWTNSAVTQSNIIWDNVSDEDKAILNVPV